MLDNLKTYFKSSIFACAFSFLAGVVIVLLLPEGLQIPLEWSLDGEVMRIGSPKPIILVMPLIMMGSLCLIAYMMRFKRYQKGLESHGTILTTLMFATTLGMILIQGSIILSAFGLITGPPHWSLGIVGVMFILIGNYLPKTRANALIGYRLPFIMNDEVIWRKTHRFAAPILILGGLYLTILGLRAETFTDIQTRFFTAIFVIILVPLAYSLLIWSRRQKFHSE